jgi:hypothetical protein
MADLLMKMPLPYEPKEESLVNYISSGFGNQQWWLSAASRPTITQSEEIPFLTLNLCSW